MDYAEITHKYNLSIEDVITTVELARRSIVPRIKELEILEHGKLNYLTVNRIGLGPLKIRLNGGKYTNLHLFDFKVDDKWQKYSVLILAPLTDDFLPDFQNKSNVVLRIDSGCETGQVFGDVTCECRDQLLECMEEIAGVGEGMIINIPRQDGRGMGLPFKLATLRLQETLGVDTVEASALLEPNSSRDIRTFAGVVAILKYLEIPEDVSIHLMTNNPQKLLIFKENGYINTQMRPLVIEPTEDTRRHLEAKEEKLGHIGLITSDNNE